MFRRRHQAPPVHQLGIICPGLGETSGWEDGVQKELVDVRKRDKIIEKPAMVVGMGLSGEYRITT